MLSSRSTMSASTALSSNFSARPSERHSRSFQLPENIRHSYRRMLHGFFHMRHSAFSATRTEPLTSASGRDMQSTARRKLMRSAKQTAQTSTSGASSSTTSTSSFRRYVHTPTLKVSSSRVTFLSESAVPALTHGSTLNSSIWIHRLEHHLMHSLQTVRTGDSRHTTGKRWLRTISPGGRLVLQRCPSTSMHSVSTISSDSSVSGKFLCGQRVVSTVTSTLHYRSLHMNSRVRASM